MKAQMVTMLCAFVILTAASPAAHSTLVMHLDFEGGFSDSSGFGHHAVVDTRSATGSIVTTTAGGISGDALSIQGLGWLAVANTTSLSPTNAMTLSAWVNPTGKIGSNAGIFFKGALVSAQPDWQILINDIGTGSTSGPSGAITSINGTGFATNEADVIDYSFLNPIPTGAWTHLASTYDGAELRLYVNGTLVGTDLHADTIDALGSDLYIGNRFAPAGDVGSFQGLMDELRIYNTALSAGQVRSLAGRSAGVPEPTTLALMILGVAGLGFARGRGFGGQVSRCTPVSAGQPAEPPG